MVHLSSTHYTVCEDVGTLAVDLVRSGSLDDLASVEVKVKQQTAKERLDYVTRSNSTVIFLPGSGDHLLFLKVPF